VGTLIINHQSLAYKSENTPRLDMHPVLDQYRLIHGFYGIR